MSSYLTADTSAIYEDLRAAYALIRSIHATVDFGGVTNQHRIERIRALLASFCKHGTRSELWQRPEDKILGRTRWECDTCGQIEYIQDSEGEASGASLRGGQGRGRFPADASATVGDLTESSYTAPAMGGEGAAGAESGPGTYSYEANGLVDSSLAGVAQSAERLFRKQQAEGSIPSTSSTAEMPGSEQGRICNPRDVGSTPTLGSNHGGVAQLVERLPCKQDVAGSSPAFSTQSADAADSARPNVTLTSWAASAFK